MNSISDDDRARFESSYDPTNPDFQLSWNNRPTKGVPADSPINDPAFHMGYADSMRSERSPTDEDADSRIAATNWSDGGTQWPDDPMGDSTYDAFGKPVNMGFEGGFGQSNRAYNHDTDYMRTHQTMSQPTEIDWQDYDNIEFAGSERDMIDKITSLSGSPMLPQRVKTAIERNDPSYIQQWLATRPNPQTAQDIKMMDDLRSVSNHLHQSGNPYPTRAEYLTGAGIGGLSAAAVVTGAAPLAASANTAKLASGAHRLGQTVRNAKYANVKSSLKTGSQIFQKPIEDFQNASLVGKALRIIGVSSTGEYIYEKAGNFLDWLDERPDLDSD